MCLHYNPQAPRSAHRRTTSALRTWDSDRRSRFSLSTSESRFEGGGWGHNSWDYDTCFILSTSKPSEEPRQRPQSQPVWLYETETPKGHYEVHLHSICVFLLWGVCHASLQRAWSKAVSPPLEAEMRGPGRSVVGAPRPGVHLWCALPAPPCSTMGVSHLATFCSLKSILLLSQCELCPVYFLEVFPPAHGRGIACERVSSGARSGSHVLTQVDEDGQVELFLQNEDEWFWLEMHSITRGKICDLLHSLRLCHGAPLLFCPVRPSAGMEPLSLAWGTSQGPTQWWVHRRSRAPKTRAATESAPV